MLKILIVDDDPDIVDSVGIVLKAEGYAVAVATSREEAMRAVAAEKPDLIILDVMMEQPDDGFVVAQDLRHKGLKTPILILSSIGHVTGYKYGRDSEVAPVDDFVSKPIAPQELLGRVKALLAGRK
ncbi:response regulator [candidate division WOR-3 bacterium]|nr:response regulator [candidate division WOR-3 bacterium]